MSNLIELSSTRIYTLSIYLALSITFFIFCIMLSKRGNKSRNKMYLIRFFFFVGLGLVVNIIYSPFAIEWVQNFGNHAVIGLTTFGIGYLLLFAISLEKSQIEFTDKKSNLVQLIIFILSCGYFIFPVSFEIDYSPIWSTSYVIYCIILTQSMVLLTFIYGGIALKRMKTIEIKRRMRNFLFGIVFVELVLIQAIIKNAQYADGVIMLALGLSMIPGSLLIYFGVGRKMN